MSEAKLSPIKSDSVVKSVGRVLEVFELMRELRQPLTGTEIARSLGYPKSSTNAILKSLVALGYLSLEQKGLTYFPSLRLAQLADWVPAVLLGSGESLNLMNDLHSATGETVTLSLQNDLSVQFLRVITGTHPISLQILEGYMAPLFGTGVGAAILSAKPDEEVHELADRANSQIRRRRDRIDSDIVIRELKRIREKGYAAAYDRLIADSGAVAMLLPESPSSPRLVVAVAGLSDRIHRTEDKIVRTMRLAINRFYTNG